VSEPLRLTVPCSHGSYDVLVGRGVVADLGGHVVGLTTARRCALVTDSNVDGIWADEAAAALCAAGIEPVPVVIPAGEGSKSWAQAGQVIEAFSEAGLGRDSFVVALGGGVVGDLAGFAAATYLRGIPVVQVPTTLLAQADSSIGGKTGVDLPRGKNLAGAFWPPLLVLTDVSTLETLPDGEWLSGLAEVAKSAVLSGEVAFAALERDAGALLLRESAAVESAVIMAAGLKCAVVGEDERESGQRESLNYGHTLGHAIERVLGYGTVSHGRAVADGMRFAARLAADLGIAQRSWADRQERLLDSLALLRRDHGCDPVHLLDAMRADKKVRGGDVRFVMSVGPGEWTVQAVSEDMLASALSRWCAREGER